MFVSKIWEYSATITDFILISFYLCDLELWEKHVCSSATQPTPSPGSIFPLCKYHNHARTLTYMFTSTHLTPENQSHW